MSIPFYKKDDSDHNNWYTKFKYVCMAPAAVLRFCGLIISFSTTYLLEIVPNSYDIVASVTPYMFLLSLGVYPTEIKNKHLINHGIKNNAIMVYNHVSIADVFVIFLLHQFAIVINSTYGTLFKHIINNSDGIIIEKKPNQTDKIIEHVRAKKRCLIIAPEGQVTNGTFLAPFKLGAFAPLHPVQPILLRYKYNYCNPFFSEDHPCIVLYRMLTQFITFVSVEVLPVMYPLTNETPAEFADRVRTIMAYELPAQKYKLI